MAEAPGYRFVIADDHPLVRGALRQTIEAAFADADILEAGELADVTRYLEADNDADLVLLDLAMPGMRGFSGLMYLRAQFPGVPVVIVSANEDHNAIRRTIEFGASGYIPKSMSPEQIAGVVRQVIDGEVWLPDDVNLDADDDTTDMVRRLSSLTPQQVRVLMMLSEGLLNKQIAYELTVSEATVKAHVSAILQKLRVDSRTQAVIAASKIEAGQWQLDADTGQPS